MTLAAVRIEPDAADALLERFRAVTRLRNELKGSRIDLSERALFFDLLADAGARATVGIAISATRPEPGADRGDHDRDVYAALLQDVIGSMLLDSSGCLGVVIDDGRYDMAKIGDIRNDIAALIAPFGLATMEESHARSGLQIADVVANTFFNRALVNDRQARIAAMVAPLLESGRIKLRLLDRAAI